MKNILLLEDLPEIRAWLKVLINQVFPDAQISESARVHDALGLVSALKFDLALVDLGLPDFRANANLRSRENENPDSAS